MTEQDARNHLHELWQNGEMPNNFDENHSDFEKAKAYTIKNGQFNYDDFYNDIAIIKFGIWRVDSDSLVGDNYYIIHDTRFWETQEYNGHLVWSWLIHIVNKSKFRKNIKDFNTAFFFCQDYFKKHKPNDLPYVSTAQSLYIQNQLLEIDDYMNKNENLEEDTTENEVERMLKYLELKSNIKFL